MAVLGESDLLSKIALILQPNLTHNLPLGSKAKCERWHWIKFRVTSPSWQCFIVSRGSPWGCTIRNPSRKARIFLFAIFGGLNPETHIISQYSAGRYFAIPDEYIIKGAYHRPQSVYSFAIMRYNNSFWWHAILAKFMMYKAYGLILVSFCVIIISSINPDLSMRNNNS